MKSVKYWNIWDWLLLVCAIWNLYVFFTAGSIVSLIFGAFCGVGFYLHVK